MVDRAAPGTISVLVVEDEYFLANDLSDLLGEEGFAIVGPHGSLFGALKAIAAETPAIGMLDVNLQGEMCYPLIDELLARSVPVVIVTGYDGQALPQRFEACVRVVKPYCRADILSAIHLALAGASSQP